MTDDLPDFRRMPVPEALAWLAEHGEPADPRPDIDTASLVRRFPRLGHVEATDVTVDGPHGAIAVRSYRDPRAVARGRGLVWVHGGAFIGGHLDMPESNWVALELASRGIPVLAVDYTKCLAGIHFPVPADEVLAAWRFALSAAPELLGVAPEALALGGASAGSTLAAGVVTQLIAEGDTVPSGLVLVYPLLHPNGQAPSTELDLESPQSQLTLNYAGSVEALSNPRAFAGLGTGADFPRTLVAVCENDPLRPSGEAFAATLASAGRPVDVHLEPGAEHGHIDHPGDAGALATIEAIADWLAGSGDEPTHDILHAFREAMVVPDAEIDFAAFGASEAMQQLRRDEESRALTDWANLGRYRADNRSVRAGQAPDAVFIGASVVENWAQADPSFFANGRINRGIGGQTSAHVLVRFAADVVRLRPRVVHILVGTNDIAGNAGPVSDEDFFATIGSMLDIATANRIAVVVASITPALSIPWQPGVDPAPTIARWNEGLRALAAERSAVFADYVPVLADAAGGMRADLSNDGVHPHRRGYELMRPVAENALREALASRPR